MAQWRKGIERKDKKAYGDEGDDHATWKVRKFQDDWWGAATWGAVLTR